MILVKYVGAKPLFVDHLFGTGLSWRPGEAHEVEVSVALGMLRFPTFEVDGGGARWPVGEAVLCGDDGAPCGTGAKKPPIKKSRRTRDESAEAEALAEAGRDLPLVDLHALDKAGLVEYARRHFRVALDGMKKNELIETIRLKMSQQAV